ncbi:unnamed protein product [Mesocestoides corti]|uniref:HTH La-type RNA-binding domain-containing protein n=1 Tax=Mesocestoides corti TaxID=53468 RepID=A0A0R3U3R4_MESCO|nr:unnamed protein product [Mesocestoides corti]
MSDRDWPSLQVHHDGNADPQPNVAKPLPKIKPPDPTHLSTEKEASDRKQSSCRQKNKWKTVPLDYTYSKEPTNDSKPLTEAKSNKLEYGKLSSTSRNSATDASSCPTVSKSRNFVRTPRSQRISKRLPRRPPPTSNLSTACVSANSTSIKSHPSGLTRKVDRFRSQPQLAALPPILPYSFYPQANGTLQLPAHPFGYPIVMIYAPPENYIGSDPVTTPLFSCASPESNDQNVINSVQSPGTQTWIPTTVDSTKPSETASTPVGVSTASIYLQPPGVLHLCPPLSPVNAECALQSQILHQIEFYFSENNLVRDTFLRRHMDSSGWVPISVIAKFNRVASLSTDLNKIIKALLPSQVVEVDTSGMRVRCRDRPTHWVIRSKTQNFEENRRVVNVSTDKSEDKCSDSGHRTPVFPLNPDAPEFVPSAGLQAHQRKANAFGDGQRPDVSLKPSVVEDQVEGEGPFAFEEFNSNASAPTSPEHRETRVQIEDKRRTRQISAEEDIDDTMLSHLLVVAPSLCPSVFPSRSNIAGNTRDLSSQDFVAETEISRSLPEDGMLDDINSQLIQLANEFCPPSTSVNGSEKTGMLTTGTSEVVDSVNPEGVAAEATPASFENLIPATGVASSLSTPTGTSASLLGNVPTSTAPPFIPSGATLLPAVLAYPTSYLPPASALPHGACGRGSRFPQPPTAAPLLCPPPWIPMPQFFQPIVNGFGTSTSTQSILSPCSAQPEKTGSNLSDPTNSSPSPTSLSTGTKATSSSADRPIVTCSPGVPTTTPVVISPAAPGFFLYSAGANGEFHALPVAPLNPSTGAPVSGTATGLINSAFVGLPRPLLPQQPLPFPPTGLDENSKIVTEATPVTFKSKKPTPSGFFPGHYEARRPAHVGPHQTHRYRTVSTGATTSHSSEPHVGFLFTGMGEGKRLRTVSECSYGLERRFRSDLFKDFEDETLVDYEAGHLYGLEKFWAYLHYSKNTIEVNPKLSEILKKYKTLEDFRANFQPPDGFFVARARRRTQSEIITSSNYLCGVADSPSQRLSDLPAGGSSKENSSDSETDCANKQKTEKKSTGEGLFAVIQSPKLSNASLSPSLHLPKKRTESSSETVAPAKASTEGSKS